MHIHMYMLHIPKAPVFRCAEILVLIVRLLLYKLVSEII